MKKNTTKREKQTRYLSQAIQLEEAVNPHIIRATMTMVSAALLAFIAWAGVTNINEVARTPGEVVPQGYQQTVQHLEGGIINAINVHEGQLVEAGQVLLVMNGTGVREDLERAQLKQQSLEMRAERLRAFVDGREPDFSKFGEVEGDKVTDQQVFFEGMRDARQKESNVIRDQIKERRLAIRSLDAQVQTAQGNLSIAQNMMERRAELNKKGYASDMQLMEDRRQVNLISGEIKRLRNEIAVARTEISQYEERLESLGASHKDEALEQISAVADDMAQNAEIIAKLEERIGRMELRAPVDGVVKGLSVNTIGAVIQPGQTVMEIVPMGEEMEVSVKISPQDIGHLKIGQNVQVKFSTFDFSRYGFVQGKLDHISATTFSGDSGERYYQGRVLLNNNYVGNNPANKIMPGMTVMADIITGKKTILQYMLKPIHLSLKTAFTER